jgi:hypothetical protein
MPVVFVGKLDQPVLQAWLQAHPPVYPSAAETDGCFFCGEPVGGLSVEYAGHAGRLLLHPGCVVALTMRLYHDVAELHGRLSGTLSVPFR